jgi:L-lactate dehydrogenase complex protein LldG
MSVDARTAMLDRIRITLKRPTPAGLVAVGQEWEALPRYYDQASLLSLEAKVKLLQERLLDYDAEVTRVADHEVAETIATVLAARGNLPTLLPVGFPERWTPPDAPLIIDNAFSSRELDRFDGVVTAATTAIADTGTVVLQNVPGQGRRAGTLIPDFHLCVVRAEHIVQSVPEAFARLASTSALPTTFVSGPSATADIEMTRIKGVHGPRFLHIVLVERSFLRDDFRISV